MMLYATKKTLVLRKEFIPNSSIFHNECYALFRFMVTKKPVRKHYLDPRHKWIHNAIEEMIATAWENLSTDNLIYHLKYSGFLENAGGEAYIRKLLGNFDQARDME